jgi:uncharacterized membrane protein HdeD (DUF308 family)
MHGRLPSLWWMLLAKGVLALAAGTVAIIWPGITLFTLIVLFGAAALAEGLSALVVGIGGGWTGRPWWEMVVLGVIGVAAGVGTLLWPGLTAITLLALIACWAIARGLFEIAAAIALRKVIEGEWILILSGFLSIGFGLLLFVRPGAGALAVVTIIGFYLIVVGALATTLALRLRHLTRFVRS